MISPTTIKLRRAENLLEIDFEDGYTLSLAAEFLRVQSPSAEVTGHTPAGRKLVAGKKQIAITGIEPTGNYAIRLTFSDGHDTGIFSWDYLRQLGRDQPALWRRYLALLEASGLSR
ncbi:MAG: DUF971 domain-containing protein [Acidocella sp.]|nr:DUF971 domain-containing protein [Acidocella sp.]